MNIKEREAAQLEEAIDHCRQSLHHKSLIETATGHQINSERSRHTYHREAAKSLLMSHTVYVLMVRNPDLSTTEKILKEALSLKEKIAKAEEKAKRKQAEAKEITRNGGRRPATMTGNE